MAEMSEPKKMTAEELEREWYENVYRGDDMPQLTLRAVIMGSFLGAFLSLQNLYVGLKTGWGLGVAITSCVLSFTIWKSLRKLLPGIFKTDMSILENNAMQSTASSAGYSTGGTIVSAISAYLLVNGQHIGYGLLSAWVFFLAVLGVCMAIPMKRQMINVERLKFPSGIAAAETLKSLHGISKGDGGVETNSAKALFIWGAIGIAIATVRDWFGWIPSLLNIFGRRLSLYTIQFDMSMILVAAGAIMGFKVCVSLLIGALLNWGVLAPIMMEKQVITHPAPHIISTAKLQFPLTIPAGSELNLLLISANRGYTFDEGADSTAMRFVWPAEATYASMSELENALNALTLPGNSALNPFHEKITFAEPRQEYQKGMLEIASPELIHNQAKLELPKKLNTQIVSAAPLLTFRPGAEDEQQAITHPAPRIVSTDKLSFPLTIPAHSELNLVLIAATKGHTFDEGADTSVMRFVWPVAATFAGLSELASALNAPTLPDTSAPNPFHGKVSFAEPQPEQQKGMLEVSAAALIHNQVKLTMPKDQNMAFEAAAPVLNFEAGAEDDQQPGGYRNIVSWSLWAGAACMVTSGLLAFIFEWRTALRAFSGLKTIFSPKKPQAVEDPLERIEVPGSWFAGGMTFGTIGIVLLAAYYFQVPWWMGVLAVILSFFLALVACRACGETDTTPVGAMGKITQLTFGAIAPRQMNTNLMTACITAGVADSASDLLTDLKSGYLLGANARKQFLAQFAGIFIGTAVTVPAFFLVVPDVSILGSTKFPAPSAQVWASVARLLSNGFESLHPTARLALVIGGVVGLLIPMAERMFPKYSKFIPSAMGLGLAVVLPFYNALSMFIGGLIALIYMRLKPATGEQYTIASASGIIAGESLMGIFITLLGAVGWI